jgi:uncharacterized membrane protein YphA (DoxX/SURF4 family)
MSSADRLVTRPWAGLGRGPAGLGRLFLGLGLIGFAVENVLFGAYVVARATPWPADPAYAFLFACVTAALFAAGGLAVLSGRWVRELALEAAFLILVFSLAMHWPKTIAGPPFSGDWTNALKAVCFAAGPLLAALASPEPVNRLLAGLRAIVPHACAPFFLLAGIQHILFVGFVETLVPPFIPGARFWTYFAAFALLAAGFGLLMPPVRRIAAILTGWMVFSWVWLVHLTLVFTRGREEWKGVVEALAISGVCFLIAAASEPRPTGGQRDQPLAM